MLPNSLFDSSKKNRFVGEKQAYFQKREIINEIKQLVKTTTQINKISDERKKEKKSESSFKV